MYESNLKKSVSASHLHQWAGQSTVREWAESTRSSLPPVFESRVCVRNRAASLDDLLTSNPPSSSSLSVATTIRNSIGQIQTNTDNYLLPRQLENKRGRVVNPGSVAVRRRKDPVPIPVQNRAREGLGDGGKTEVLNNGQLRTHQELNNHRSHRETTHRATHTVHTQSGPKKTNPDQSVPPEHPPQSQKPTTGNHRLQNGDHAMVKTLAVKFSGTQDPNNTTQDHTHDHAQHGSGHAQNGVISGEDARGEGESEESFEFMGFRVTARQGGEERREGEGGGEEEGREGEGGGGEGGGREGEGGGEEEGREGEGGGGEGGGREGEGGGGEGEGRDGGRRRRVTGKLSISRGRRVAKDQRPKVNNRSGNSNRNNNTSKSGDIDRSRDADHSHPDVGKTTVDKNGILRTMC